MCYIYTEVSHGNGAVVRDPTVSEHFNLLCFSTIACQLFVALAIVVLVLVLEQSVQTDQPIATMATTVNSTGAISMNTGPIQVKLSQKTL